MQLQQLVKIFAADLHFVLFGEYRLLILGGGGGVQKQNWAGGTERGKGASG